MFLKFKNFLFKRYLPRWTVMIFDLHVVAATLLLAFLLRFNFNVPTTIEYVNLPQLVLAVAAFLVSFLFFKPYSGILRHSTTEDIARVVSALTMGTALLSTASYLERIYFPGSFFRIPLSVVVIHFALTSSLLLASRIWAKLLFRNGLLRQKNVKKVLLFGAGRLGMITRNALMENESVNVSVAGFIEDNASLQNKRMAGIPIYSMEQAFKKVIPRNNISEIIIAVDGRERLTSLKRELVERCLPLNIAVKIVPSVDKWINGELSSREIKEVKIEELLERDTITLNSERISAGLKDAVVLVAGAAGSIGSEIVRQLMTFNAHHVVLLDKAESALYDLQNELKHSFKNIDFTVIVGDVTNAISMRRVFEQYSPTIVLNAAAYKHVPLMETFPNEAIRVNVGGTRNLADLSVEFGVEKFVFISTDKAVNPTNVMGATKRIAEIYVQSMAQSPKVATRFITTRFGNVLGSNGSVVPLFKKQIENGGPLTVTHKDITRYFMTIPEACQLVLEASFLGKGGEIFIFDMGEPVRIYDLAEKMIFLSGFVPHTDIDIEVTSLRPGEKLYEELLLHEENLLPTHNDKIMIGKVKKHEFVTVSNQVTRLLKSVDVYNPHELISMMRGLVPEYEPMNSPWSRNGKVHSGCNGKGSEHFQRQEELAVGN